MPKLVHIAGSFRIFTAKLAMTVLGCERLEELVEAPA